MSVLRGIGRLGLVILAAIILLGMYIAVREQNWWGAALCVAFLVLLALFNDVLRIQALREARPHVAVAPNRRLWALFQAILGILALAAGVAGLVTDPSLGAALVLGTGLILLASAFRAA